MQAKKSETGRRALTAFLLVGVFLFSLWGGNLLFGALLFAVLMLGLREWFVLVEALGFTSFESLVYVACSSLLLSSFLLGPMALAPLVVLFGVLLLSSSLFVGEKTMTQESLISSAFSFLGILYLGLSCSSIALLYTQPQGAWWVLFLVLCISLSDTVAYFGGRLWGKTPLYKAVSPKKTIEGSLCGLVGAVLGGLIVGTSCLSLGYLESASLSLFVAFLGQVGDLWESRLKRVAQVKDSGGLLGAHGGILDRIDGYTFAAPCLWALVLLGSF